MLANNVVANIEVSKKTEAGCRISYKKNLMARKNLQLLDQSTKNLILQKALNTNLAIDEKMIIHQDKNLISQLQEKILSPMVDIVVKKPQLLEKSQSLSAAIFNAKSHSSVYINQTNGKKKIFVKNLTKVTFEEKMKKDPKSKNVRISSIANILTNPKPNSVEKECVSEERFRSSKNLKNTT